MRFHPNELVIFYDPTSETGKKARAMAYSLTKHVNEVQTNKNRLSTTIWKELLGKLQLRPKDLLNRAHPEYQSKIAGNAFDDEGWLNVLSQNPNLLKAPIALKNKRAILCTRPNDVLKLA